MIRPMALAAMTREAWADSWRHVRRHDGCSAREGHWHALENYPMRGSLDELALRCLSARRFAREDEEHRAPHPLRVSGAARRRVGMAVRSLRRRGFSAPEISSVAARTGLDGVVSLASTIFRANRALIEAPLELSP